MISEGGAGQEVMGVVMDRNRDGASFSADHKGIWLRNLEPVGRYILETNEKGEVVADWLLMDKAKNDA